MSTEYELYEIVEGDAESPSEGSKSIRPIKGYPAVPEDDVDYIVNLLRIEGRQIIAVRSVPDEDLFGDTPREFSIARLVFGAGMTTLVVAIAAWGWHFAQSSGLIEALR
tara:strand:+ start:233 stop:559 length:327 start_codon:yes stop_codon:yes gene_type:complete